MGVRQNRTRHREPPSMGRRQQGRERRTQKRGPHREEYRYRGRVVAVYELPKRGESWVEVRVARHQIDEYGRGHCAAWLRDLMPRLNWDECYSILWGI